MTFEDEITKAATAADAQERRQMLKMEQIQEQADRLSFEELLWDRYHENYAYHRKIGNKYIVIKKGKFLGLANTKGFIIFPAVYRRIGLLSYEKQLFSVKDKHEKTGIIDIDQNIIVPFGKYGWVKTYMDGKYLRARRKDGYDLIDVDGNVILYGFDEIWNYNRDFKSIVVKVGEIRYSISHDNLDSIRESILAGKRALDVTVIMEYQEYLQNKDNFSGIERLYLEDFLS